jgi:ADP-heptose:LPS heptosyltransferase
VLDWEGPEVAALLQGDRPRGPLGDALSRCQGVLAYTRSAALLRGLEGLAAPVLAQDPNPAYGHASRWLAEPVRAWGADPDPSPPAIVPSVEEELASTAFCRDLPRNFLALHPGSGSPAKNWPPDRFAALARAFSPDRPWLLVAGPAEAAEPLPPGAVLARDLPLRTLGAVLARAGLFVGNDSGVSHLAAAWGTPTLALFGPTDPEVWSPQGPRVGTLRAPKGRMTEIGVDAVVDAARAVLG